MNLGGSQNLEQRFDPSVIHLGASNIQVSLITRWKVQPVSSEPRKDAAQKLMTLHFGTSPKQKKGVDKVEKVQAPSDEREGEGLRDERNRGKERVREREREREREEMREKGTQ